jgi:hypothetical protein
MEANLGNMTNTVSNHILSLEEINELTSTVLAESSSISNVPNSKLQEVKDIGCL